MVTDSVASPTFSQSFKITTTPPPPPTSTTSQLHPTPPKGSRPTPHPLILLPHQQFSKEGTVGCSPVDMDGKNERVVVVVNDASSGSAGGATSDLTPGGRRGDTVLLSPYPSFEMLVVGCGGGPLETNLSSYLIKPYSAPWAQGCTSIEGGSGLGALSRLIESSPYSFRGFGLDIGVDAHEQGESRKGSRKRVGVGREGGGRAAAKVWHSVRSFAITHSHLDHIQGLIISSGASLVPRPLYGSAHTLQNLSNVFDGGVWPELAGWEKDGVKGGRAYLYREIIVPTPAPLPLSNSLSMHAYPLSHGMDPSHSHSDEPECYDSTAFFIREDKTGKAKEVLFFGDVEPDSISKRPLNRNVWKCAAPKIVAGLLNTIFLECSYPTSQPKEKLWGHLSPPYVMEELQVLAGLVVEARISSGVDRVEADMLPLKDVTVIIIHIKDDVLSLTPPILPQSPLTPDTFPQTPTTASSASTFSSSSSHSSNSAPRRMRNQTYAGTSTLAPHSPLTMSPPLPSIPIRRASACFGTPYHLNPNYPSFVGTGDRNLSRGANAPGGLDVRRYSSPGFSYAGSTFSSSIGGLDGLVLGLGLSPDPSVGQDDAESPVPGLESTREESVEGNVDGVLDEDEDDDEEEETVHERIERELNELEEQSRLGVRFYRVEQGSRIAF